MVKSSWSSVMNGAVVQRGTALERGVVRAGLFTADEYMLRFVGLIDRTFMYGETSLIIIFIEKFVNDILLITLMVILFYELIVKSCYCDFFLRLKLTT